MGDYIPLSQSFAPIDPTAFTQELDANRSNQQTIAANKIKLNEAQRLQAQDQNVRATVQKNTTIDPTTGVAATDQKKVVQDLYITDPEAAEKYQSHVEDIQAERATKAQEAQKAKQAQADAIKKTVGEALSAVDETGDQDQAKSDYAAAVQSLKDQGIPIQPGDEVYSPGRVGYWKRLTIGAPQIDKEKSASDINNAKLENAAKIAEQKAESAAQIAKQRGADAKEVAAIRNQGAETAARIRASATVQAATIRGGGGGGSGDDEDEDNPANDVADYMMANGGKAPALGNGAAKLKAQALHIVNKRLKAQGKTMADLVTSGAGLSADEGSLKVQQKNADTVASAENTALANGQIFLNASKNLSNQHTSPAANAIVNFGKRHITGDPNISSADAALKTFTSEYARVISSSPSGSGQLTDSARNEALGVINSNQNYAQKKKAFETLQADMRNRVKATQDQLSTIRGRIMGRDVSAPKGVPTAPAGSKTVKNSKDGSFWFQNLQTGALTRAR